MSTGQLPFLRVPFGVLLPTVLVACMCGAPARAHFFVLRVSTRDARAKGRARRVCADEPARALGSCMTSPFGSLAVHVERFAVWRSNASADV